MCQITILEDQHGNKMKRKIFTWYIFPCFLLLILTIVEGVFAWAYAFGHLDLSSENRSYLFGSICFLSMVNIGSFFVNQECRILNRMLRTFFLSIVVTAFFYLYLKIGLRV